MKTLNKDKVNLSQRGLPVSNSKLKSFIAVPETFNDY